MKRILKLEGLDCADCAAKLERAIEKLEGVQRAGINFITLKCSIEAENMDEVLPKVTELIKKEHPEIEIKRA
ncbi:MAG: heavy metal-associated domain-containing protein [Johnsonella sp.]|nr:heavy metal-associated domain-containing protein [Johnsonella sp.]